MRWTRVRSRRVVALVLGAAIAGTSCKDDPVPSFSISAANATAELLQGTSGTLVLTVTRANGYTADIELTLLGTLPEGVTAEFSQNPVPDGEPTVNIAFTVPGAITPGETDLTVQASGEGVADQTLPITLKVNIKGSHSVTLPNPTLTVSQGGGGSATVAIPRTGANAGNVTLTATAPAGLTATFAESPTTAGGTSVAIAVAASVATGSYPVTISASQVGVSPDPQATLTVVVVAPKPTTDITLAFCNDVVPNWFAYQNEGFNWKQGQPAGNLFSFAATDKVGITFAFLFDGGGAVVQTIYATRQELVAAFPSRECFGTRTLTGTGAGIGATQIAAVTMGNLGAFIENNAFELDFLPSIPLDLVAIRGTEPENFTLTPDKMIVRRGVATASGALPVLDFGAGEAFDPATHTLTLTGVGSDAVFAQNNFGGSTGSFNRLFSSLPTGSVVTTYWLPAARAVAGDLHNLYVEAFNLQAFTGRLQYQWHQTAADRSMTLSPTQNASTFSLVGTAPYVRFRGQVESQSAYGSVARFVYFQPGKGTQVEMTSAYAGGLPTTWDVTLPDLTSATGFQSSWMPSVTDTDAITQVYSGRPELIFSLDAFPGIGADAVDADVVTSGFRFNTLTFTSGAALRAQRARAMFPLAQQRLMPGPPRARGAQYFRR